MVTRVTQDHRLDDLNYFNSLCGKPNVVFKLFLYSAPSPLVLCFGY